MHRHQYWVHFPFYYHRHQYPDYPLPFSLQIAVVHRLLVIDLVVAIVVAVVVVVVLFVIAANSVAVIFVIVVIDGMDPSHYEYPL